MDKKKYKKFFITTILTMLVSTVLISVSLIYGGNYLVGRYTYSEDSAVVHGWIETKNKMAKQLDNNSNKIVFVGGSSTLHGLNSEYARKKSGLPILNYGIHAGLDVYIFEQAKAILKPNDIVIMPLEFIFYEQTRDKLQSPLAEYIISYDNKYYRSQPLKQKLWIMFFLVRYYLIHPNINNPRTIIEGINSSGDCIDHNGTTENFAKDGVYRQVSEKIPDDISQLKLYDFIKYCQKNNIKVYATAPNAYHPKNLTPEEQVMINNILKFYKHLNVEFLGNFTDGFYDNKKLFCDTSYHLNTQGSKLRTDFLLDLIYKNKIDKLVVKKNRERK